MKYPAQESTPDLIEELGWKSRGIAYDITPVYHATINDLDMAKIQHFLATRKSATTVPMSHVSVENAMLAYQIIKKDHGHTYPTVAGILIFGNNPQFFFSEARIMCAQFPGTTIGSEVVASQDCLGTLDEQFKKAYNFVIQQLNVSWKIVGPLREERLEIPVQAIREIIINAIIHRNYHISGPSKIAVFDNRIEIFSPGSFPGPIVQHLKSGFTYPRNTTICKILREMGMIETFGLGFLITFSSYEKENLKTPEIIDGENFVKCILPRRVPEGRTLPISITAGSTDLTAILHLFLTATEISVSDVVKTLHLTRVTASRKLAALVAHGFLKRIGKGRGIRYIKK